jgi:hypothetical protein
MADKQPSGFQMFLGEMLLPMFLQYGKTGAKTAIQKAIAEDTDTSTADLVKTANVALYPVTDTVFENWAAKSKTKIDDKAVGEIKELQEELADEGGYTLPNLDEGQAGD